MTARRILAAALGVVLAVTTPALALAPGAMRLPRELRLPPEQRAQYGLASFYCCTFQGRRAADGSVFDQGALTAAHRTLAFGTRVRVTNMHNGRRVIVRITDRGPFVDQRHRIIDLSLKAADVLGGRAAGTFPVEVVPLP
jgi:rare lipoprotein A